MRMKTNDGTPDAVKIACPVWNGGKGGDNFKTFPPAANKQQLKSAHQMGTPNRQYLWK